MRDIKFRAWDNYSMLPWEWLDTSLNCVWTAINAQQYDNPEPILMQYTGLKDKNGKEIYEGDILSEKWKFVVEYIKDGFYCTHKQGKKIVSTPISVILDKREKAGVPLEVIGSIYEHPELLEGVS